MPQKVIKGGGCHMMPCAFDFEIAHIQSRSVQLIQLLYFGVGSLFQSKNSEKYAEIKHVIVILAPWKHEPFQNDMHMSSCHMTHVSS